MPKTNNSLYKKFDTNTKRKYVKTNGIFFNILELFVYILGTVICALITTLNQNIGIILLIIYICALVVVALIKTDLHIDISTNLAYPITLSVFQNIYLGVFAYQLSSTAISFFTITNFIYSLILFVGLMVFKYGRFDNSIAPVKYAVFSIFILLIYGIALSLVNNITAFIAIASSMRNIISVFVFFVIGYMVEKYCDMNKFLDILLVLGFLCVLIGFYEILFDNKMWVKLNITELWTKKGINVQQSSGLPTNFYSSEVINGSRIRRMTASFADPVNLGSFLFMVFIIAIYRKKKFLAVLFCIAMVFTVSKLALLGCIVYICVKAYYSTSKGTFAFVLLLGCGIGFAYLLYAYLVGAGSVFVHMAGLFSALQSLIYNIFGSGLGSNGVLASQFTEVTNSSITESGLGMIIGQLGIVGLVIFIIYFVFLYRNFINISNRQKDIKVILITFIITMMLNIFFNEVALSPNTCAGYFIIMGAQMSKLKSGRKL